MIRDATTDDIESILLMCEQFWGKTGINAEFERDQARSMIEACWGAGFIALIEEDNVVYGFIAIVIGPSLASTKYIIATELAWWINPSYRGRMQGVKLLKYAESKCIDMGVSQLSMLFMEASMPARVEQMYRHLGYKLQETTYAKVFDGHRHNSSDIASSRGNCCEHSIHSE